MDEITYRDAHAALANFIQNFAAPMLAIVPVLEKVRDAEEVLQTIQPQIDEKAAELAERVLAVEQAKNDRETVIAAIEHDREVKQADADRRLAAYETKVQARIDELTASLAQHQVTVAADMQTLDQQITDRTADQRALDTAIQQKRVVLAELSGKLLKASVAVE